MPETGEDFREVSGDLMKLKKYWENLIGGTCCWKNTTGLSYMYNWGCIYTASWSGFTKSVWIYCFHII